MSIRKSVLSTLLVMGSLGYAHMTQASCQRNESVPTVEINMEFGQIVVPPDAGIGTVIASQSYNLPAGKEFNYECTNPAKMIFDATLVNPGAPLGDGIYASNIKGIGIRLTRIGKQVNIVYPSRYTATGYGVNFDGSVIKMELIKTAETTGSGAITPGLYSQYSGETGTPLLKTSISNEGIIIVSPSCEITSDRVMNIDMPEARIGDFTHVGSTSQSKPFGINLKCSGGVTGKGHPNINVSFSGNIPSGHTSNDGVLTNEYTGSDIAKGIGIQVVKDNHPVKFNDRYLVGELNTSGDVYMTIPLVASYYQYDAKPTEGRVESNMVYNIDYD